MTQSGRYRMLSLLKTHNIASANRYYKLVVETD